MTWGLNTVWYLLLTYVILRPNTRKKPNDYLNYKTRQDTDTTSSTGEVKNTITLDVERNRIVFQGIKWISSELRPAPVIRVGEMETTVLNKPIEGNIRKLHYHQLPRILCIPHGQQLWPSFAHTCISPFNGFLSKFEEKNWSILYGWLSRSEALISLWFISVTQWTSQQYIPLYILYGRSLPSFSHIQSECLSTDLNMRSIRSLILPCRLAGLVGSLCLKRLQAIHCSFGFSRPKIVRTMKTS